MPSAIARASLAVATRERERCGPGATPLAHAVARYYFKLLAYKDEYEVARLWTDGSFRAQLDREFSSWKRIELQLAPQLAEPARSRHRSREEAHARPVGVRCAARDGAPQVPARHAFDPFGWTAHRRRERALIGEYEATLDTLLAGLAPDNRDLAVEIASLPEGDPRLRPGQGPASRDAESKQRELLEAFRLQLPAR